MLNIFDYFIYVYTTSDGFIRPVLVHSTADVTSTCRLQDPTNCGFEEQNLHSFYSKHCVLLPNSSGHTHRRMLKVRTNSTLFLNILPLLGSFSLAINFLNLHTRYQYQTTAFLLVILHDFLDHVDGIVAKAHRQMFGQVDDPLLGGFMDAFCDKVTRIRTFKNIYTLLILFFENSRNTYVATGQKGPWPLHI